MAKKGKQQQQVDLKWPSNLDIERLVLGGIIASSDSTEKFVVASRILTAEDFSVNKHRIIFGVMRELYESGSKIDRVTILNELERKNKLTEVDGISYLVSLDEGMPEAINLEEWAGVVKEKSRLRSLMSIGLTVINMASLETEKSNNVALQTVKNLLEFVQMDGTRLQSARQVLDSFEGGPLGFMQQVGAENGLPTGYTDLDERTGGMRPGELIILAARPSMGKTALATNIATNVALNQDGSVVAFFSLEMSKEALLARMACAEARVDQQKFRAGMLNKEERLRLSTAVNEIYRAGIYIDDSAIGNLVDIHSKILSLKAEVGLDLVVIDYLQLMSSGRRSSNRVEEVSHISRGLKLMAKEVNVPFLVLSQLSRAPEQRGANRRPQLSDLRESGSIEQDADTVWFIYRPEYYKPNRSDLRGLAELIIGKQRNGPTGTVKLTFIRSQVRFQNYYPSQMAGQEGVTDDDEQGEDE